VADTEPKAEPAPALPRPSEPRPAAPKKRRGRPPKAAAAVEASVRKRTVRPYPAMSFDESLPLGEALQTFGAGDKMRRLLLCEKMKR